MGKQGLKKDQPGVIPEGGFAADALSRVQVVLCRPRYGGNVGSVARAIKNMGLGGLILSTPDDYLLSEARMMAVSAGDVLGSAAVTGSLHEALEGFPLALGVSRRVRSSRQRIMSPREAAVFLAREVGGGTAALVFGPEDSGLTAEELSLCHGIISIPSDDGYPSLNLSHAVMVVAYETRMALASRDLQVRSFGRASREEYATMLHQVETVLERTGFFIRNPRDRVMLHLKEIFARGVDTSQDARIIRGAFRRIAWAIKERDSKASPED